MNDRLISFESSVNSSYLVYKIKDDDNIDKIEHFMLTNNKINGLLELKYSSIDNDRFYKYDISSKVSLARFLDGNIDKNKLIKILLSMQSTLAEVEDYMIFKEHLILDENYVFVDVSNYSVYFVCLPIDCEKSIFQINEFIKIIIYSLSQEFLDGINHMSAIYKALDSKEQINIKHILNILKLEEKSKNSNIQVDMVKEKPIVLEAVDNNYNSNQKRSIKKIENVDFLVPDKEDLDKQVKTNNKMESKLKELFKLHKVKKKEMLCAEKIEEKDEYKQDNSHTILISHSNVADETSLLNALNSGLYPSKPYLLRQQNDEKIYITSDLFRIGKETDYVDYAISYNDTISRTHADIIRIDKDYYIQDNNSKNHTYVNNNMISDGQAIKLEHNFEIKLSDEKFIFKLY